MSTSFILVVAAIVIGLLFFLFRIKVYSDIYKHNILHTQKIDTEYIKKIAYPSKIKVASQWISTLIIIPLVLVLSYYANELAGQGNLNSIGLVVVLAIMGYSLMMWQLILPSLYRKRESSWNQIADEHKKTMTKLIVGIIVLMFVLSQLSKANSVTWNLIHFFLGSAVPLLVLYNIFKIRHIPVDQEKQTKTTT